MAGYWWQCEACGNKFDFQTTVGYPSMSGFVWDKLLPSGWDQSLLTSACPSCKKGLRRITYDFPREEKVLLHVVHIVGLQYENYVPMMWETYPVDDPDSRWFDFKYQHKRSPWGLNKAAVFSCEGLQELFTLYRAKTGATNFP